MNVQDLISAGATVNITLTMDELKQFGEHIAEQVERNVKNRDAECHVLYTQEEVAKFLRVSTKTVQNYENLGILKPTRIGGLVRYTQHDLDEIAANKIRLR